MDYFRACKLHFTALFVSLYILSQLSDIGSQFWLSAWSDESKSKSIMMANNQTNSSNNNRFYRLGIYASFGLGVCMLTLLGNITFLVMYLRASKQMHDKMLHSVLRAPLRFFESTPTGRILNRFTNDIKAIENVIPLSIKSLLSSLLSLLSVIIVISKSTPLFLIALIPMFIAFIFVQVINLWNV